MGEWCLNAGRQRKVHFPSNWEYQCLVEVTAAAVKNGVPEALLWSTAPRLRQFAPACNHLDVFVCDILTPSPEGGRSSIREVF